MPAGAVRSGLVSKAPISTPEPMGRAVPSKSVGAANAEPPLSIAILPGPGRKLFVSGAVRRGSRR